MKTHSGFTLIELMIVIAIIAILAAILIPSFIRARQQGQLAACESNERNIGTSLEMYANDNNGQYPVQAALGPITTMAPTIVPTYMRVYPVCPAATAAAQVYQYRSTTAGGYSVLQGLGGAADGTKIHPTLPPAPATIANVPAFSSTGGLITH